MTPEQFKNIWTKNGDSLSPIATVRLQGLKLQPGTIDFLATSGLPFDASPFLSFVQDKDDSIRKLTDQFDFLEADFDKYLIIGSSGEGDIIVINSDNNDQIEWLDHEDGFSSRFFNSSIKTLAVCLLIYKDFISTIQQENGEDAYFNSEFSDSQFDKLKADLTVADNLATTEGFWKEQLETELVNREHYRDAK